MFDPVDFDPALLGLWPVRTGDPVRYGAGTAWGEGAGIDPVLLETKAVAPASPVEELQTLLNDMTGEMRLQFEAFRRIRMDAEAKLASGDEAEQKIAKADIKAANDALSLL
eukprot:gene14551-19253_t